MMNKCADCGKLHDISYHLVDRIERKGFPTSNLRYEYAHRKANEAEKAKYPSGYEAMKKVDSHLDNNELAGKNTESGEIYVSRKVPRQHRNEVALHEYVENQKLRHKEHR